MSFTEIIEISGFAASIVTLLTALVKLTLYIISKVKAHSVGKQNGHPHNEVK